MVFVDLVVASGKCAPFVLSHSHVQQGPSIKTVAKYVNPSREAFPRHSGLFSIGLPLAKRAGRFRGGGEDFDDQESGAGGAGRKRRQARLRRAQVLVSAFLTGRDQPPSIPGPSLHRGTDSQGHRTGFLDPKGNAVLVLSIETLSLPVRLPPVNSA